MENTNEINRLSLDMVSSYIITLFGNYMEDVVEITKIYLEENNNQSTDLKKNIYSNMENIKNLRVKVLKKSKFTNDLLNYKYKHADIIKEKYKSKIDTLRNTIIGLGLDNKSNDAHWIYIDEFGDIHNSYNNGLQIDGSNQFCQCYALLMAINPYFRNNFKKIKNSYVIGYYGLIELWKLILNPIINYALVNSNIHYETIQIIYDVNKDEDLNIVNFLLESYFNNTDLFTDFMNILNSPYAIENAPFFI